MTLLNAIIINPVTRTVTAQKIEPGLQGMYAALAVDPAWSGTIERFSYDQVHDLWLDENGCLEPGRPVFLLHDHPFAGVTMILSHDDEGESRDCTLPLAEIDRHVAWTDLETTGGFTEGHGEDTPNGFLYVVGEPIFRRRT
jgi:hypothetical protein